MDSMSMDAKAVEKVSNPAYKTLGVLRNQIDLLEQTIDIVESRADYYTVAGSRENTVKYATEGDPTEVKDVPATSYLEMDIDAVTDRVTAAIRRLKDLSDRLR